MAEGGVAWVRLPVEGRQLSRHHQRCKEQDTAEVDVSVLWEAEVRRSCHHLRRCRAMDVEGQDGWVRLQAVGCR